MDFFLIPLMLIARLFGLRVFEVKAKAFGHSIEEPYVLSLFYEGINKNKKFLLFNSKKSFNNLASNLFRKNFKIIENYSYFSPFYWMSRSPVVGISRQFLLLNDLKFINRTKYQFYEKSLNLNWEYFINDETLENQFRSINPQNKKYILWKPRISKNRKHLRDSSVNSMKKLFDYLIKSDYLIFSLSKLHPENMPPNYIPLYSIFSDEDLNKLNFKLDYHASYFIVGDTGGWVTPYVLDKPLLVYDVGLPCNLYKGAKKCLIITKIFKSKANGKCMKLKDMLSYRFDKIHDSQKHKLAIKKIIDEYYVINNTEDDIYESFLELENKCKIHRNYFPIKSYKINRILGKKIPKNTFNINGPVQLSDNFFEKNEEIFSSK